MTRIGALALALAAVGCGHPEQRVVDQYFNAINAKDNQTLSSFAVAKFNVERVDKWSIVTVSPENRAPAPLPDMVKKAKDLDAQIAANKKAANQYLQENPKLADVIDAERKGAKVPAGLQGLNAEWQKFNEKDRELKRAQAEAKDAADKEKRDALLSVANVPDIETVTGEVVDKSLDLMLTIKGEQKPYSMVLRKYELQPSGQAGRQVSRWIVHRLEAKG